MPLPAPGPPRTKRTLYFESPDMIPWLDLENRMFVTLAGFGLDFAKDRIQKAPVLNILFSLIQVLFWKMKKVIF